MFQIILVFAIALGSLMWLHAATGIVDDFGHSIDAVTVAIGSVRNSDMIPLESACAAESATIPGASAATTNMKIPDLDDPAHWCARFMKIETGQQLATTKQVEWVGGIAGSPLAPMLIVSGTMINVRKGPSISTPIVGQVQRGQKFTIVARDGTDKWWQICCFNHEFVWVADQCVDLVGPLNRVSVIAGSPPELASSKHLAPMPLLQTAEW